MSDPGPMNPPSPPPVSSEPVQQTAPAYAESQGQVPQVSQPAGHGAISPKRSRAWIWWTVGIVLFAFLLVASCAVPLVFLARGDGLDTVTGDAVAVIRIDGVIAGTGDYYSGYITPEYFYDLLDQAAEDDDVKAVVLRVDCPGGTVAASQEIALYVQQCEKPVVVSSGDVNASGAYMVSSQADQIWALPGSAVGSVGVIAEIPNVSGLLEKLGVDFTVITAGENKDTGSPYRPMTAEERALIQGEVDEAYDQFVDIVAQGRDMERSRVESLATGWAWSGQRAKELGLVDEIGTYEDALDAAADLGGIEGDYDIITYEDEFGDLFGSLLGLSSGLQRLATVAEEASGPGLKRALPR